MLRVIEFTSQQTQDYHEDKYQQFLHYYLNTDLTVSEIHRILGLNKRNSTVKYINRKLKKAGYDSLIRYWKIKRGEWL